MVILILLFNTNSGNNPAVTPLIIGAIGILVAVFGAVMRNRRKRLLKSGVKVEGTVMSIERETSNGSSMSIYYPVIQYLTLQNESITKKYNIGTSSSYKEGDTVTVIYDPNNTTEFTLNDTASRIVPLAPTIIGLAMIIGAIITYTMR